MTAGSELRTTTAPDLTIRDAEPKMGDPGGLDHPRAFELDLARAEVLEQPDPVTDQNRHEVDLDLVKEL